MSLTDRQAVYRCYDAGNNLLYIGASGHLGARLRAHAQKIWFLEVRSMTFDWYPDARSATTAEQDAIEREEPQFNVMHNAGRHRDDDTELSSPVRRPTPGGNRRAR